MRAAPEAPSSTAQRPGCPAEGTQQWASSTLYNPVCCAKHNRGCSDLLLSNTLRTDGTRLPTRRSLSPAGTSAAVRSAAGREALDASAATVCLGCLRLFGCALFNLNARSIASRTKKLHPVLLDRMRDFSVSQTVLQPMSSAHLWCRLAGTVRGTFGRQRRTPCTASARGPACQRRAGRRHFLWRHAPIRCGCCMGELCPVHSPGGTNNLDSFSQPLNEEQSAAHAPADGPLPGPCGPSQPQLVPLRGPAASCGQSRLWRAGAAQQSAADGPSTAEMLRRRRQQRQLALWKVGLPWLLSNWCQGRGTVWDTSMCHRSPGCLVQA